MEGGVNENNIDEAELLGGKTLDEINNSNQDSENIVAHSTPTGMIQDTWNKLKKRVFGA